MLFLSLDHPAIACFDVREQIAWYCTHLGMRVVASNGQDPPGVVVGYGEGDGEAGGGVAGAGAMIELMPARDPGPRPADVPRFAPGLRHLALRVSDFDAAYERLRSAGIQFLSEPGQAVGGGKIASFRDPEGNELQIVQRE